MNEPLTVSSMMEAQYEFEQPRGLFKVNTIEYGLMRMLEEWEEARDAYQFEPREHLVDEVADIIIFGTSVLMHLAHELDWSYEHMEDTIRRKMEQNHIKYDQCFFDSVDPRVGIRRARHYWNNHLPEHGNDIY